MSTPPRPERRSEVEGNADADAERMPRRNACPPQPLWESLLTFLAAEDEEDEGDGDGEAAEAQDTLEPLRSPPAGRAAPGGAQGAVHEPTAKDPPALMSPRKRQLQRQNAQVCIDLLGY